MKLKKSLLSAVCCTLFAISSMAQSRVAILDAPKSFELGGEVSSDVLSEASIMNQVSFLADSICRGRAMGTTGAFEAGSWIIRQFKDAGIKPFGTFVKSFVYNGTVGHNIIGFCPSPVPSPDYIIVAAHYDNIGELDGHFYPGADSNASGVSAVVNLARIFSTLSAQGHAYKGNFIFVAFDGKQLDLSGSQAFYSLLEDGALADPVSGVVISPKQVKLMVNLDIIGSSLEPVRNDRKDYLIMLSRDKTLQRTLSEANVFGRVFLDLSFDYYGSPDFTSLFYKKLGDQKVFLENGINSVFFTSGITMRTNKLEDSTDSLDIPVLRKRTLLIYRWLERILMPE